MATIDDLIDEILAELRSPVAESRPYIDLDTEAPSPVRLPADEPWVGFLNDAEDGFECVQTQLYCIYQLKAVIGPYALDLIRLLGCK